MAGVEGHGGDGGVGGFFAPSAPARPVPGAAPQTPQGCLLSAGAWGLVAQFPAPLTGPGATRGRRGTVPKRRTPRPDCYDSDKRPFAAPALPWNTKTQNNTPNAEGPGLAHDFHPRFLARRPPGHR
ncbi:hypothetical protein GCM10011579_058210 [Streptomyces albiflavescens]|uniref:Uncharacterized protein n=1 Tax=Streptomyces albiflavescens TaxID=1623582 RepID=A0A917Y8Y0_9ACTN|nr:hypothetical protein GCM10011579_058210 [Streptomyces albiflavescens]